MLVRRHGLAIGLAFVAAACATACTTVPESEGRGTHSARSSAGHWEAPESDARGAYEGLGGEGCSDGLKPGTKALGDAIEEKFGTSYGGYACRANTANPGQLSIHAVGRALDITVSGAKGTQIANYLVENASALGIQLVIWNRGIWQIGESGGRSKPYGGPHPHTDHVHAEVNRETAENGAGALPDGETPTDPGTEPGVDPNEPTPPPFEWCPAGTPMELCDEQVAECETAVDCDSSGALQCIDGFCEFPQPNYWR